MKSIIDSGERCYICGSYRNLECHHIFGGSERKLSEKFGLKVMLCHNCHNEPPNGVHHNRENMDWMHRVGQEAFEKTHTRKEFMELFQRGSYL